MAISAMFLPSPLLSPPAAQDRWTAGDGPVAASPPDQGTGSRAKAASALGCPLEPCRSSCFLAAAGALGASTTLAGWYGGATQT